MIAPAQPFPMQVVPSAPSPSAQPLPMIGAGGGGGAQPLPMISAGSGGAQPLPMIGAGGGAAVGPQPMIPGGAGGAGAHPVPMISVPSGPAVQPQPMQWTPDSQIACCAARAVAAALRNPLSGAGVLALYRAVADDDDAGARIPDVLRAARGLGARRPGHILGLLLPQGRHAVFDDGRSWWSWGSPYPRWWAAAVVTEAWVTG